MDGYRAYGDHLVPAMFERWSDPEIHFRPNDSFYRNDLEQRIDYNIHENICKSNETKTNKKNIAYNLTTTSNYMFIPYFGAMQRNTVASSSIIWHHPSDLKHPMGRYLSTDATPFIPTTPPSPTTTKSKSRKYCTFYLN